MTGVMSCSVALSLRVTKPINMFKNSMFTDGDIKNIVDSLGKLVDLNLYDIKKSSEEVVLTIKKEIFNKNIQDLYLEISSKTDLIPNSFYLVDVLDYNYPKEELKIYLDKENIVNMEEPDDVKKEECNMEEYENLACLLSRDCKHWNQYRLGIKAFKMFLSSSGVDKQQLCLLNWFKKDYFKNPLNGSLIFHNWMI